MRIDFNVLWVDDQPESIESYKEGLEPIIREHGFRLIVQDALTINKAKELVDDHILADNFDLIMVDFDLGAGQSGDNAIREIRNALPYKDIIFYSGGTTIIKLRQLAFDQAVESVYYATRDNLVEIASGVFDTLIKKVIDIDQSRGIVMGATSDIDSIIIDVLRFIIKNVDDTKRSKIFDEARKRIKNKQKGMNTSYKKLLAATELSAVIDEHSLFSSNDRIRFLMSVIKKNLLSDYSELLSVLADYHLSEIPNTRNLLGHKYLRIDREGRRFLDFDNKPVITFDKIKEIRSILLSHHDAFIEQHQKFR
jgi:CheY-like chemotaxis protein